jgi:hypothetical protein
LSNELAFIAMNFLTCPLEPLPIDDLRKRT